MDSIFDDETSLPGVITHVEADYGYGYDTSLFGSTDSMLVIGTAFNGPVGTPQAIYSPEHAQYMYGGVYDSKTRKEASLVAGIQDAWDRGCRTIYGVRIGGKDISKDFSFKTDIPYKLRLSSQFPSNSAKECYMRYDATEDGDGAFHIYKPSDKATISEKKRGLAANGTMIKLSYKLYENGLTKEDRLVDLIQRFNGMTNNNVLMLNIVDKDGNIVTNSPEVYDLPIGILFSGVYFIGRDHTSDKVSTQTKTTLELVNENSTNLPYSTFDGKYFRSLSLNTDVSLSYPIYGERDQLRAAFEGANVSVVDDWDFLDTEELTDRLFVPDDTDYEETQLSKFEIYKRLGSGYAVTAHAIKRKNGKKPRVKETESTDKNKVQAIDDGIYSILQDHNAKYRVVACANAEDEIDGKLPRAEDFAAASANSIKVLGGPNDEDVKDILLTANIDSKDLTQPRKYEVSFVDLERDDAQIGFDSIDKIDTSIRKVIADVKDITTIEPTDYANGTVIAAGEKLYRIGDKTVKELQGAGIEGLQFIVNHELKKVENGKLVADTAASGKDYVLAETLDRIFVYQVADGKIENIGDFATLMTDDEDKIIVAAESVAAPDYVNKVVVRSNMFDTTTVEELVDDLNSNEVFSKLFTASITQEGLTEKDDFVNEADNAKKAFGSAAVKGKDGAADTPAVAPTVWTVTDRENGYDYNLYIPYRTTDNFLRQLAQHCTYTELKTAPTHGIMGTETLTNTGLASVAAKATAIANKDFDLYAKNKAGQYMYTSQNLPYPIGKNVSLVCAQYPITVGNANYVFQENGASGYAGMVTTLPIDQSSTGQAINLNSLSYMLTASQIKKLTAAGVVTLKQSYTKGIVVTDGITMAPADSVYRRLNTSRIVGACEELIRAAAEPFIGKENHQANRNALNTAIKSNLDKIKGKIIENYSFVMNSDPTLAKFSYIEIDFQIIPIYEIRQVRSSIKMVDSITSSTTGV